MPDSSAGSLHLSEGLRVTKAKEHLNFAYPAGRGPFRGNLPTETEIEIYETRIPAPGSYEFPALNKRLVVEDIEGSIPGPGDIFPEGEYLDSALFSFPLTLRRPEPGDRFHPLGAPGSKKVFDFLSDQKIDRHERHRGVRRFLIFSAIRKLTGMKEALCRSYALMIPFLRCPAFALISASGLLKIQAVLSRSDGRRWSEQKGSGIRA
jgi:tRNA(Ile)-lysidine synthetase-like protein